MSSRISTIQEPPRVGALLRQAWLRVRERIYEGIRGEGYVDLNPSHVALFRYEGLDGRRPTQIAEEMHITKQSVNDLLRHLERGGYITLRIDPDDRRARLVRLTQRGRRLDASVRSQAQIADRELASAFGKSGFRDFLAMLSKIADLGI